MFKKLEKRFVSFMLVMVVFFAYPMIQANAATKTGEATCSNAQERVVSEGMQIVRFGQAESKREIKVYENEACTDYQNKKIFAKEGFTIVGYNSKTARVCYNGSNGAKWGWIFINSQDFEWKFGTDAAMVNTATTLWYGPDASKFQPFGMLHVNDTVSIIERGDYWALVECNTTEGKRCRGFVPFQYLSPFTMGEQYIQETSGTGANWEHNNVLDFTVQNEYLVYAGPTEQYKVIGKVYVNEKVHTVRSSVKTMSEKRKKYISYKVNGALDKAGYIFLDY